MMSAQVEHLLFGPGDVQYTIGLVPSHSFESYRLPRYASALSSSPCDDCQKPRSPNVLISSFFCRLSNESGRVAQLRPGSRLFVALSHMHAQPAARLHRAHSDASLGTLPLVFCNLPPTAAQRQTIGCRYAGDAGLLTKRLSVLTAGRSSSSIQASDVQFRRRGDRQIRRVLTTVCRDQRPENDSLQPDRPAARYRAIAGGGGEVRRR